MTPVFTVSCVTGENLNLIKKFLNLVPPARSAMDQEKLAQELTEYQVSFSLIVLYTKKTLLAIFKGTCKCHLTRQKYLNLSIKGANLFVFCFHLHLAYQIHMKGYFLAVEPALKKYFCTQQSHQENSQYKTWTAGWV